MFKTLLFLLSLIYASSIFSSENIIQVLKNNQFTDDEIEEVTSNYPELIDVDIAFEKRLESTEDQLALKLYAKSTNDIFLITKNDIQIDVSKSLAEYRVEKKLYGGQIVGDLFDSINNDYQNVKLAISIDDAFKEEFSSTKGLKVEANYSFEVENYLEGDQIIKLGNILNAKVMVGKALVEKVRTHDLITGTWNLSNLIPSDSERIFESPVGTNLVSSVFNLARRHPVKRNRIQPHNGIDFIAKSGTPVFPALEGTIKTIGHARAKGKFIVIEHANGMQTTYDHLRKFQKGLRAGMYVDLNDQLGEVGRTGYATGAHLHFGLVKNGLYVNPIYYLKNYQIDSNQIQDSESEE